MEAFVHKLGVSRDMNVQALILSPDSKKINIFISNRPEFEQPSDCELFTISYVNLLKKIPVYLAESILEASFIFTDAVQQKSSFPILVFADPDSLALENILNFNNLCRSLAFYKNVNVTIT